VLLTKGALEDSNTWYAQGGISAVLDEPSPGDTVAAHIADTLRAGAGHCNEAAVRLMCTQARRDIDGLQRYGVAFDAAPGKSVPADSGRNEATDGGATHDDGPALGLEAAHSAPRILHAGGDATGARVAAALIQAVLSRRDQGRLTILPQAQVTALLTRNGNVSGVEYLHAGRQSSLAADAVLLASGGAGQLFAQTTNPAVATADGLALGVRAGAAVKDLEFFQFHPTCLVSSATAHPGRLDGPLLISEAVRGEGATLLDAGGRRFMQAYHPDAELAPRDVVSRSIALHLAKLGDPNGHVYLDARGIEEAKGEGFLGRRFPTLTRKTFEAGIDWTRELVPVAPAAHYWMGGVATDLSARTTVPGLYAAGEVACTGVQGANRLASNSLLEGLVFGRRAVEDFLCGDSGWVPSRGTNAPRAVSAASGLPLTHASASVPRKGVHPVTVPAALVGATDGSGAAAGSWPSSFARGRDAGEPFSRDALRSLMTANAGVLRSGELLSEAAGTLAAWAAVVRPDADSSSAEPVVHEDRNLLLAARLLVAAALNRTESLGAHYRSDEAAEPENTYPTRPKASLLHD
jgi:L-aspartate oxidase